MQPPPNDPIAVSDVEEFFPHDDSIGAWLAEVHLLVGAPIAVAIPQRETPFGRVASSWRRSIAVAREVKMPRASNLVGDHDSAEAARESHAAIARIAFHPFPLPVKRDILSLLCRLGARDSISAGHHRYTCHECAECAQRCVTC